MYLPQASMSITLKKAQPFENASLIHPAIGYTLKYSIEQSA